MGKYWFEKPRFVRKRPAYTMRTYILWFILGSIGMHRFYLGYWRTGLAYIAYLTVTLIIELSILDKMPSLSWETRENISLSFTGFIWTILFIDVFLIRGLIDRANEKFTAAQAFN